MNKKEFVEALLYATNKPLSIFEICKILNSSEEEVKLILNEINECYRKIGSVLEVKNFDNRYTIGLKKEHAKAIFNYIEPDIPKDLLETLGYIAIKQPIYQAKVVKAIGRKAVNHIKKLVEMGFLEVERKNNRKILKTTEKFSEYFGLSREIDKMKKELAELMQNEVSSQ